MRRQMTRREGTKSNRTDYGKRVKKKEKETIPVLILTPQFLPRLAVYFLPSFFSVNDCFPQFFPSLLRPHFEWLQHNQLEYPVIVRHLNYFQFLSL